MPGARSALLALAALTGAATACGSQQAGTNAESVLSAGDGSTDTTTGGQASETVGGGTESGTTGVEGTDATSAGTTTSSTDETTSWTTSAGSESESGASTGTTAATDTAGSTTTGDVDTTTGDTDSTSTTTGEQEACDLECEDVLSLAGNYYNPDYYDEGEEPCANSEGPLNWEQMTVVVDKIMGSPCDPGKFKVGLHSGKLNKDTLALMTPQGARVAECLEFLGAVDKIPVDFQEIGLCPFEVDAVLDPLKNPGANQSTSFPKTEFSIDADKYQSVTTVDLSVRDPQGDYIDGFRVTPFADKDIENCHVSIVASPPKGDSFLLYKGEDKALVNNELNPFNFPPQSLTAFDTTVSLECILDEANTFIFVSPRTLFNEEASPKEKFYNLYLPSYSTVVEAP